MARNTLFSTLVGGLLLACLLVVPQAHAADSLDNLLNEVRQFQRQDGAENRSREQAFSKTLAEQQQLLSDSRARLERARQRQEQLKAQFDGNEAELQTLEERLRQRSGQLGEVFGVVKQHARELQGQLQDSLVSAQYPQRDQTLAFADSKRIPTLQELETLWYSLQQEMTESGRIQRFETELIAADGSRQRREVVRVGSFTAVAVDGSYLNYLPGGQQLVELPRQPAGGVVAEAAAYAKGQGEVLLIDPTRGALLALLDKMPSLSERLQQGGAVGYIILALGLIGLLVAAWRLLQLARIDTGVRAQLKRAEPSERNPLGRVLQAADRTGLPLAELELRIDEAIVRELPGLERGQTLIKLLAAVAPLLGLLGTVTGMIGTFQSITLFGTSDPKLMAGGISQALITTVFGLVVAIPLLFSHSLLSSRSRRILQILQQKSLGRLAEHREQQTGTEQRHAA
ncbi:MotA/TolQ/ExbB proton channel family protein [Marinobacterium arenosum]|uniref:MotA/TolQ/ExbB proton channel family protein n=1 Tax=Marinobacterium arenosum TaxID=2862496 RepID=UPI001C94EFFB|nr:MotA/TolQ/ExbB proton channel family protein [Marinobacterium arenosum]MBY4678246.1 MotA/TolQ/ExbB proton channel family protein [Marinobacterium arenosum]